jgi:DNA-directed RNA polymerase subunit D
MECTPEEAEADKCVVDGKPCYARLYIDASADGKQVIIYSKDIKPEDPDVKPVYDNIPVVPLIGEQKVKVVAYARLGRGREHAKWMPATVAVVKPILKGISVKDTLCGPGCQKECAEKCPEAFEFDGNQLKLKDGVTLSMLMYCIEYVCEGKGIRPVFEEGKYIFELETDGSLSARRTLAEAAKAVVEKLNALKTHLQSAEG